MRIAVCVLLALVSAARAQDEIPTPPIVMAPIPKSPIGPQFSSSPAHGEQQPQSVQPSTPARECPEKPLAEKQPMCPPANIPFLPTGFIFPALLPDAIYSYNTLAPTVAVVEDDIKFLGRVVIPKGSHLIGETTTLHTFDRVNIAFHLVVFPEGCEAPLNGLALSADDGSAGIKGKVEKHEDSVAAQIAMKAAITGAQAGAAIVAPVEGAVSSAFTNEASSMLDQGIAKAKSLDSIYIHERTQIRIFNQRRFMHEAGK
jgi:hypothetical protein